jgi:hypothetical protein
MVDVSSVPKTKSRTPSDGFGSAGVSSSGRHGLLRKAKHPRSFVYERALSPTVAKVLSAGADGYRPAQRVPECGLNVCTRALSSVRR